MYQSETEAEEGDLLPRVCATPELKSWWRDTRRHQFTDPSQIKFTRLRLSRDKSESLKNFVSNFLFPQGMESNIPDVKVNSKT